MIRKSAFVMLLAMVWSNACAINPITHENVLSENPQTVVPNNETEDEADPYYLLADEASKAIDEGDYVTAILRLKEAISIKPESPTNALLLSNLGIVYSYMGQDSLSMNAYNRALELAPNMTTVLGNRGLLNLKLGRDAEAFRDFEHVIERDSLNMEARFYHGLMSLYSGKLSTAEIDFSVLKSQDPDGFNTNAALAAMYSMTGNDKAAIPCYKALIEMEPSAEYFAALAGCYLALQDYPNASATIADGIREYGEDPELYYYRAWLNRDCYLLDAAKSDAKRAIELGADRNKVNALFKKK